MVDIPHVGALTDFLAHLHGAVLDQMFLFDLPLGSNDLLPRGHVEHGPWPAASRAAVIRAWHTAGWLQLYYQDPPNEWRITVVRLASPGRQSRVARRRGRRGNPAPSRAVDDRRR